MTLYVDTAAAVKLFKHEPETAALSAYLGSDDRIATSVLTRVELTRTLRRGGVNDAVARVAGWLRRLYVMRLTDDIVRRAQDVEPPALRSLDAIHVASALDLGDTLDALVTYDTRMVNAATAAGLTVMSPR